MTDTPKINAALAELQKQLPAITKDQTAKVPTKTGGSYQYTYADLAQISRQVLPVLGNLGLAFTSRPTVVDNRLMLVYELRHVSGEQIDGVYPLPDRGTPQEIGGAITYARRYCLCAITGVAPDDDDNDAMLAERAARKQQSRQDGGRQREQNSSAEQRAITADQQRRMQTLFRDLGIGDREKKVRFASGVVKRDLKSATELTQFEAGRVIKKAEQDLQRRAAGSPGPHGEESWPEAAQPANANGGAA